MRRHLQESAPGRLGTGRAYALAYPFRRPRIVVAIAVALLASCDQLPTDAPIPTPRGATAPLYSAGPGAIPGRYLVVLRSDVARGSGLAQELVASVRGELHFNYTTALQGFAATLSPEAVEALRRNPVVEYVAEDAIATATQTTQPYAVWGLDRIDQRDLPLTGSYTYAATGAGVRAYVIDSGIRTSHVEFGGRASVGADFIGDGLNGQDCSGHGTHVAGTIGGNTYGVAKGVSLIAVRVFGCTNTTPYSTVIAAVDWVTANAVRPAVVNMSLGGPYSLPVNQAVQASITSGIVYSISAGNESTDACNMSPASTPEALTVGATDVVDTGAYFTNWGGCLDLFAPGVDVLSSWFTDDGALAYLSGTSMAAPHVAGVAALFLETAPTASPAMVAQELVNRGTGGRLSAIGTGSPNLLLHSILIDLPPAPTLEIYPGWLDLVFVRGGDPSASTLFPVPGDVGRIFQSGGDGPPRFEAQAPDSAGSVATTSSTWSGSLIIANRGNATLEWSSTSSEEWLSLMPGSGALTAGYLASTEASVDSEDMELGLYTGTLAFSGDGVPDVPVAVSVQVVDGTPVESSIPVEGLTGTAGSASYYVLEVPANASSLTISTSGGSGDVDLYVRYAQPPTLGSFDCRPYVGGNSETCASDHPPAGTYYIMLRGFYDYADATLLVTIGGPPAVAPANLTGTATAEPRIELAWTDLSVNETSFDLQRATASSGSWGQWIQLITLPMNSVDFHDLDLIAGDSHRYRIRACNLAGCSAWTTSETLVVPSIPQRPTGVGAVPVSASRIDVAWVDMSDNEAKFTLARRSRDGEGAWSGWQVIASPPANANSHSDTGLAAGMTYQYRIRACNPTGCSSWRSSSSVTIPLPPFAPVAISGEVLSATRIAVSWIDASGNESNFRLARRSRIPGGSWTAWQQITEPAANVSSYSDVAVDAGTSYQYRIRACNVGGCSTWTASATVLIPSAPLVPSSLTATAVSSSTVDVGWTDVSNNESSFQLFRRTRSVDGSYGSWSRIAVLPAGTEMHRNTGLTGGTTYQYRVRACNVVGCSAYQTGSAVTTP